MAECGSRRHDLRQAEAADTSRCPICLTGITLASGLIAPARPSARCDMSTPPDDSHLKTPCRVLVVDDSVDSGDSLAAVIGLLGHSARVAYDGQAAVRAADEFRPHLVLMDLTLPVLSGYEAAARIREQQGDRDVMLVALTGWGRAEDQQLTATAGFQRHVVKPLDFDLLKQLLAEACATAAD